MNEELKKVIESSTYDTQDGTFVYCKVRKAPDEKHFLVTQDNDEITVVTIKDRLDELDLIERNKDDYRLIALNVSVPFYSVGFIAAVTNAIASGGMNVLVVSTYSKDYILVRVEQFEKAIGELDKLGFTKGDSVDRA